jgi:glucosamine-6-phosphate deaminase
MQIIIKDDYREMSLCAAQIFEELIRKKPDCVLGLATGSTPIGTYQELIRMHREGLDFSKVKTFNLDEYVGVGEDLSKPYEMDRSFARFMREELFAHINVAEANIYLPDGLAEDTDAYCRWYEDEIKKAGGIDIQLLGIGGSGHLGFNEPGASLTSRTRVEKLVERTLDDNYEAFYKTAGISREEMPHEAITMGVGTILEAKSLIMLASGRNKAEIVARALEGEISSDVPASAIRQFSGDCFVILDREAASMLKNYR